MDAYSEYIRKLSDARVGDLRREAAERAMSRAARKGRTPWWRRSPGLLRRRAWSPGGSSRPAPALAGDVTVRAEWSSTLLADSDDTVVVEGNHSFPREALRRP